jgi:hypothetical protein
MGRRTSSDFWHGRCLIWIVREEEGGRRERKRGEGNFPGVHCRLKFSRHRHHLKESGGKSISEFVIIFQVSSIYCGFTIYKIFGERFFGGEGQRKRNIRIGVAHEKPRKEKPYVFFWKRISEIFLIFY